MFTSIYILVTALCCNTLQQKYRNSTFNIKNAFEHFMIDTIYPLTVTRANFNIVHCKVQGIFPRNIEKYDY